MAREHEAYETFCRHCFQKFEKTTLAESLEATETHEFTCRWAPVAKLS